MNFEHVKTAFLAELSAIAEDRAEKTAAATSFAKEKGLGRVQQLLTGSRVGALAQHNRHLNVREGAVDSARVNALRKTRNLEEHKAVNDKYYKPEKSLRAAALAARHAHTAEKDAVHTTRAVVGAGTVGGVLGGAAGGAYKLHQKKKEKTASELSESARAHLSKKNFAVSAKDSNTGRPAYPIEDKAHARAALGFAAMHHDGKDLAEVRRDVEKKYPGMVHKEAALAAMAEELKTAGMAGGLVELGGLGLLAAPSVDKLQAKMRGTKPVMSEGAHSVADLAGLGVLAGHTLHGMGH